MTKVYLVCGYKCNKKGIIEDKNYNYHVDRVFTNKKLAFNCKDWLNKEWRDNQVNKTKITYFYVVETKIISKADYKEIPF